MHGLISEIDENTYIGGKTLHEAIFEFASPELLESYNIEFDSEKHTEAVKKAAGTWAGVSAALGGLTAISQLGIHRDKIKENLKRNILDLIKKGDLIPFGFKEPRHISDQAIKIPIDLFFSGELNWEKSELKYREIEFTGIRLLADLTPIIDIKPEKSENSDIRKIENKSEKSNFSNLDPDLHIDENRAAEYLGISPRTLQGYRVKGGGPEFVKIGKKTVRYKVQNLIDWVAARKRKNTSE